MCFCKMFYQVFKVKTFTTFYKAFTINEKYFTSLTTFTCKQTLENEKTLYGKIFYFKTNGARVIYEQTWVFLITKWTKFEHIILYSDELELSSRSK